MQPTITIQNLWPTVALAIGISFTALILTIEHWIPASTEWTFRQRYVAGTIAIWIGATVWRLLGNIASQPALFNPGVGSEPRSE